MPRRWVVALSAAAVVLAISVPGSAGSAPAEGGPSAVTASAIRRITVNPGTTIDIGAPRRAEFLSEVTVPAGASGPAPLVVFLHGAHPTCYQPGQNETVWPCRRGFRLLPSYRGYRYLSGHLAAEGIASVSISANGVNGQEDSFADGGTAARALMVRRHLSAIARSAAGRSRLYPADIASGIDLSRVLLVGHSRGAAGVAGAAMRADERTPFRVMAAMSLAGTTQVKQAVPGVPFVSLLPQCDGDVFDLQGQQFIDVGARIPGDQAPRAAVWVPGGNHNFLNTQWTPGRSVAIAWNDAAKMNDWPGPCTKAKRISSGQERRVARWYVHTVARAYLMVDQRAAAELEGSRRPTIANVTTRVTATGGTTRLVERRWQGKVFRSRIAGRTVTGLPSAEQVGWNDVQTPHWLPALEFPRLSTRQRALMVSWARAGTVRYRLSRALDLRRSYGLRLRVATDNMNWRRAEGSVVVRDAHGVTARVPIPRRHLVKLGSRTPRSLWAQSVTVPNTAIQRAAPGLDLSTVRWVGWTSRRGSGRLWLLDLWSLQPPRPSQPRVSIVVAGGTAAWVGGSYQTALRVSALAPAPHTTRVRYTIYGYDTKVARQRGTITLRRGQTSITKVLTIDARKRDSRLVVATYPDRWGVNLTDYVWLPVD